MKVKSLKNETSKIMITAIAATIGLIGFATSKVLTPHFKSKPEKPVKLNQEQVYEKLLYLYSSIHGRTRAALENKIQALMKQGLSREEAIRELAVKEKLVKN